MERHRSSWTRVVILVVACALSLSAIAAAPSSADSAEPLQNEQPVSATLTGNGGGAFAFYTVDYPGDESVVTIELRYTPADPVTTAGVGFNVYAPDGFHIGQAQPIDDTGGDGVMRLQYSDNNKATWLVQVYNYIPEHTISYRIVAEGLPATEPAAATPAADIVSEPQPTITAMPLAGSGYLTGNAGGAYAFYEVTVPADASDVEVTLTWSPDDPIIATGVGFVAYGPSGEVSRGTGTGNPGERIATLAADMPGVYLVQVYNYIDGLAVQYVLSSAAVSK